MSLDEHLRARLRSLVDAEQVEGLSNATHAKLITRAEEAALARRERRVLQMAILGTAALTALTLALILPKEVAPRAETAKQPEATTAVHANGANVSAQRCRGDEPAPSFDAAHTIDVPRARIVHAEGANVALLHFDDCVTELSLTRGEVFVFARALAGGALRIRAGEHEVEVHGTVFSVEGNADALTVRVDEGLVSWRRGALPREFVSAGNALVVDHEGPRMRTLRRNERMRLREALGLSDKAPSHGVKKGTPFDADAGSTSLPLPTQKVWHQGGLQSFKPPPPELPALISDDGQPLKKPTLIPASRRSEPALP